MITKELLTSNTEYVTDGRTDTVTESEKASNTPKMSKEVAQSLSDAEILQMIQKSQGHTNDFQNFMNCGFSYTYLTGLLKDRGYENGWHKVTEGVAPIQKATVIKMKKSENNTVRKSYVIEETVAEKWKSFNKNVPFPTVTLYYAMTRFMEDYESGKIKFELEI